MSKTHQWFRIEDVSGMAQMSDEVKVTNLLTESTLDLSNIVKVFLRGGQEVSIEFEDSKEASVWMHESMLRVSEQTTPDFGKEV